MTPEEGNVERTVIAGSRCRRQLAAFLAARLNPASALGLILTIQLTVLLAFGAAFGIVTEDVIDADGVAQLDGPVSRYLVAHREPWLTTVIRAITSLGSAWALVPLLLCVGLVARRTRRSWSPLAFLAAVFAGASLLSAAIKLLIARPRPDADVLVSAVGYAFPSGHSTAAAASWLAIALVLGTMTARIALRATALALAGVVVVLVGVSRVYLGVHAITDVLGGWALGVAWLAAVLTATRLLTARNGSAPHSCRTRRDRSTRTGTAGNADRTGSGPTSKRTRRIADES